MQLPYATMTSHAFDHVMYEFCRRYGGGFSRRRGRYASPRPPPKPPPPLLRRVVTGKGQHLAVRSRPQAIG